MTENPDAAPRPHSSPEHAQAHGLLFRSGVQAMAAILSRPDRAALLGWDPAIGPTRRTPGLNIAFRDPHYRTGDEREVLVQQYGEAYNPRELIYFHATKVSPSTEQLEGIKVTDEGTIETTSGGVFPINAEGPLIEWVTVPADDLEQISSVVNSPPYQAVVELDRALHHSD